MSIRSLRIPFNTSGYEQDIVATGFQAVGLTLHTSLCSKEMVHGLRTAGLNMWSSWGSPYIFDMEFLEGAGAGIDDGLAAAKAAQMFGQPANTLIFTYVHCGMYPENLKTIRAYVADFKRIVGDFGYLPGVYGYGSVCSDLVDSGLAQAGWLPEFETPGWEGFLPRAAMVEEPMEIIKMRDIFGQPVTVVDPSVLWYPQDS